MASDPQETQQQAVADAEKRQAAVRAARERMQQQAIDSARTRVEENQPGMMTRVGQGALGVLETGGMLASGATAQPIAGLMGLNATLTALVRGDEDPMSIGAERVRAIEDALTYDPRTEGGQMILGKLETVTKPVADALNALYDKANEVGGPVFATEVQTVLEGLPAVIGIKRGNVSFRQRRADISRAEQRAEEFGIELKGSGENQRVQIVQAGEGRAGQIRGESLEQVKQSVIRARQVAKDNVDELYENARSFRAGVRSDPNIDLEAMVRQSLADFDIDSMPIVQRRLNELEVGIGRRIDVERFGPLKSDNFSLEQSGRTTVIAARRDGEDLGRLNIEEFPESGRIRIRDVFVNESVQNQGIGKQLLAKAAEDAQRRGLQIASDNRVTVAQLRVYESLRRDGWPISYTKPNEVNSALKSGRKGDTVVNTEGPVVEFDTTSTDLQSIAKFRERLNRNRPSSTDLSQAAALDILKGQVDNWLDAKFNADMISGDPKAIQAWKDARAAHRTYVEQFKEDKVIRQLAEQQATPEDMRNWVFGSARAGFSAGSGRVVNRLKNILGEDSQEMMALRQDGMLTIIDPLIQDQPNLRMFSRNYNRMVRGNETLMKELFVPEQLEALDDLAKFARGVEQVSPSTPIDISQMSARALFGHGIAKAGLRVSLAQRIISAMTKGGSRANRRIIMAEFMGYDPKAPLLSKVPPAVGGGTQTLLDEAREQEQQ